MRLYILCSLILIYAGFYRSKTYFFVLNQENFEAALCTDKTSMKILYQTLLCFYSPEVEGIVLENIVGPGESDGDQNSLISQVVFLPF